MSTLMTSIVALASGVTVFGQAIQEIPSPNPTAGGNFASVFATNGTFTVIGAPLDAGSSTSTGAAYVYKDVDGVLELQQELTGTGLQNGDRFGGAVAIGQDFIAIGARLFGNNEGKVFIYELNGQTGLWEEQLFGLPTPDAGGPDPDQQFGKTVSFNEQDQLAIGATDGFLEGVWVFSRDEFGFWNLITDGPLLPAETGSDDFGASLVYRNDVVAVGAPGYDHDGASNAGAVYVFRELGPGVWQQEERLDPDQPTTNGNFGTDIDFDEATLVATEPGIGVSIYRRDKPTQWAFEDTVADTPFPAPDDIALGVDIDRGRVFTTTGVSVGPGQVERAVSAFERITLGDWQPIEDPDYPILAIGDADNDFGVALQALGEDTLLVGAPKQDLPPLNAGQAFVFPAVIADGFPICLVEDCDNNGVIDAIDMFVFNTLTDCNDNGKPDECEILDDPSLDMDGDGRLDECPSDPGACPGDLDFDGDVDSNDLNILLNNFAVICGF